VVFGGSQVVLMAGPCAVESESQLHCTAAAVAAAGGQILRGGAYKPASSPYSFQGLGEEGLPMLKAAAEAHGMLTVTEVMDTRRVELVAEHADILQVGTRSMSNFDLLREVGRTGKPVLLKRGMSATYVELLLAAEHVANEGNEQILLCERGIRTFEPSTRNTLDLCAVPALKAMSHLPVVVDPSQGTGRRDLVAHASCAAVAIGADALLIEVHPDPVRARKDGPQSLSLAELASLVPRLRAVASAVGRTFGHQPKG
jgi:3-deoxy-7-phosphoheptulonate synthase